MKIFSAKHLLPIQGEDFSPGALAVEEGIICDVGTPEALRKKYPQAEGLHFEGKTIIPGLVNAHADLALTRFGKYDQLPFDTADGNVLITKWLISVSRFKATLPIPEQKQAIQEGLAIGKKTGVTTVGDVCRYPVALSLYKESGLRVVALAEVENIQRRLAQEDFEQALALVDEVQHNAHPRLSAGLAPLSAFTLSKNLLRILASHAMQQQIPMHLIGALSFSEMEFFYDSMGEITQVLFKEAGWEDKIPPPHHMTPIQYLHEIGVLKARPAVLGCLHLGPTDSALLQHTGCPRILVPSAFRRLKVGDIPWKKLFQEKAPWALGTWGAASGSTLNLWDEMRSVLYENEAADRRSLAKAILEAATLGGARALQLDGKIGSLVPKKAADFIVLETPEGDESIAAGLIDQTRDTQIAAVVVDGILQ